MEATAAPMDALEIAEFLEGRSAGVLAMAADGGVYAVPVSFVAVDGGANLYFRLGYGPKSQKRRYVENADTATFVVFDEIDGGLKSVVAEGRLERLSASNLDTSVLQAVEQLRLPAARLRRRPTSELEFSIVTLDVDKLTGIAEPSRARSVD